MTTHVTLHFNDGEIKLFTSSFLYKNSKLLQSVDIEEDNTSEACADVVCTIPILCYRSYILDENDICLSDDKTDLSFMFTLQPNNFLEVCKFLDIICYENKDNIFSNSFILYVIDNIKEEINVIKYFMQPEIRSIMNYINNVDINIQIKSCTPEFYHLFLTEYIEEVIKHNRIDIYELSPNKSDYFIYINKYDYPITYIVKETQEYKNYIINISNELIEECRKINNINNIKYLVEQGANISHTFQNRLGETALHLASITQNNLEVVQYLVEHGADVNIQDNYGRSALHYAAILKDNFEVIKYLVEHGVNVNLRDKQHRTALFYVFIQDGINSESFNYLKHCD